MLHNVWSYLQSWMLFCFVLGLFAYGKSLAFAIRAGRPGRLLAELFVALNRGFLVFVALFAAYAAAGLATTEGFLRWTLTVIGFFILVAVMLKALGGSMSDYRPVRIIREFSFAVAGLVLLVVIAGK